MGKKIRHLRVRISDSQFQILSQILIVEHRSKSQLVRDAINLYLTENLYRQSEEEIKPEQERREEDFCG
ncbi:hypothetical protein JW887_04950 [Candidatus Dojkabacteria bacterium]|nr:hypothetical protein [Candidatus Dojkabacteria bacterium]